MEKLIKNERRKQMFREAIKEALEKEERSQTWLAKHTDIPLGSINRYIKRGYGLSAERIEKIFEFLRIKVVVGGN